MRKKSIVCVCDFCFFGVFICPTLDDVGLYLFVFVDWFDCLVTLRM
jgi:hypothetical protein